MINETDASRLLAAHEKYQQPEKLSYAEQRFMSQFSNKSATIPVFPGTHRRVAASLERRGIISVQSDYATIVNR